MITYLSNVYFVTTVLYAKLMTVIECYTMRVACNPAVSLKSVSNQ
jgi:hypothetical protein